MLVLPVALLDDPCSKQAAISCKVPTEISVDPASVMAPFDVSRICMGCFPGVVTFPACPLTFSTLFRDTESNKSLTSSFKIFKIKPAN